MTVMGKLTISTGPFSTAVKLPEGGKKKAKTF